MKLKTVPYSLVFGQMLAPSGTQLGLNTANSEFSNSKSIFSNSKSIGSLISPPLAVQNFIIIIFLLYFIRMQLVPIHPASSDKCCESIGFETSSNRELS